MYRLIFVVVFLIPYITGCGGNVSEAESTTVDTTQEAAPLKERDKVKVNNPLEKEQQLMRDAAAVQSILDKNAEDKKQAIQDLN